MGLPEKPGLYIITCGDCMPHIGTSGNLRSRVRTLATLGAHRGSSEVLCAAFCTQQAPVVWWEEQPTVVAARNLESALKSRYKEPPYPRPAYQQCVNGAALREKLIAAAGKDSRNAGFVEAVFTIGQNLKLIFDSRFAAIWEQVGAPPGPWVVGR